jgi:hypothetical protein
VGKGGGGGGGESINKIVVIVGARWGESCLSWKRVRVVTNAGKRWTKGHCGIHFGNRV